MKELLVKVIKGNEVFVPLSACSQALNISKDALVSMCHNITKFDGMEPCISETEFNRILLQQNARSCNVQLTRVQSLEVEAENIINLYPLKRIFAEQMFAEKGAKLGMSADEYIALVDYPNELENARQKILNTKSIKERIKQIKKQAAEIVEQIPLETYGLTVQFLTILSADKADIITFLAGQGIFYQYYLNCCEGDVWEESTMDEHGTITVPSFDYKDECFVLSREVDRDFRAFTPIENVIFCVHNIPATNEWTDCLEFKKGGVVCSFYMNVIMKLLNPCNCPHEYWMNGIPEIKEK